MEEQKKSRFETLYGGFIKFGPSESKEVNTPPPQNPAPIIAKKTSITPANTIQTQQIAQQPKAAINQQPPIANTSRAKESQNLPQYRADQAFVKIGLNKSPETFTRGANQYGSGGNQGSRIVATETIFNIPPQKIERRQLAEQVQAQEQCDGFYLYVVPTENSIETWISASTIAGMVPEDLDPSNGKKISENGSGFVWANLNIDGNNGNITSVLIESGDSIPEQTDTSFIYGIGYYEYDDGVPILTNYGCGPIEATICRNWFASDPPFYGGSLTRSQIIY